MKHLLLALSFLLSFTASVLASSTDELAGPWRGTLDYQRADGVVAPIYFVLNINEGDDGSLSAIAAAYQIGMQEQIESVAFSDGHLRFEMPMNGEVALANLSLEERSLNGALHVQGEDRRVALARVKTDVDAALIASRTGLWVFDDGHRLALCPLQWALAVNDLTDSDYRVYFPQTENDFVAGRGNLMPAPTEFALTFGEDENGPFVVQSYPGGERRGRPSDALIQEEITFQNGDVTLSGTLIRPRDAAGPVPGVAVVWGSGQQTRYGFDAAIYYRAVWLADRGIATLIWDKRGVGASTGSYEDRTMEELAGDMSEAVNYLAARPEVDASRVGLFVHSQSGIYAPITLSQNDSIAFVIDLASSVVNGEVQEIARTELQLRADGWPESDIAAAVRTQELKFHYANTREGWDDYVAAYNEIADRPWFDTIVGSHTNQDDGVWAFWRDGNDFEPAQAWRDADVPLLYLIGERDRISPVEEGLALLRNAFEGDRADLLTINRYQGVEHSLFEARYGGLMEEVQRHQMAPYMDDVLAWLASIGIASD